MAVSAEVMCRFGTMNSHLLAFGLKQKSKKQGSKSNTQKKGQKVQMSRMGLGFPWLTSYTEISM